MTRLLEQGGIGLSDPGHPFQSMSVCFHSPDTLISQMMNEFIIPCYIPLFHFPLSLLTAALSDLPPLADFLNNLPESHVNGTYTASCCWGQHMWSSYPNKFSCRLAGSSLEGRSRSNHQCSYCSSGYRLLPQNLCIHSHLQGLKGDKNEPSLEGEAGGRRVRKCSKESLIRGEAEHQHRMLHGPILLQLNTYKALL